jgi:hypothetical protein
MKKFVIDTVHPDISRVIQESAFENGYEWASFEKKPKHTNETYLFFNYVGQGIITKSDTLIEEDKKNLVSIEEAIDLIKKSKTLRKLSRGDVVYSTLNDEISVITEVSHNMDTGQATFKQNILNGSLDRFKEGSVYHKQLEKANPDDIHPKYFKPIIETLQSMIQ